MSDLKIYTYKKQANYSVVDNELRDCTDISDSAFRTLIWLLNRPKEWQLNIKSIAKIRGYSVGKATTISKELQSLGYLWIQRLQSGETIWHVSEVKGTFKNDRKTTKADSLSVTTTPDDTPHSKNWNEEENQQHFPHSKKPHSKNCNALVSKEVLVSKELQLQHITLRDQIDSTSKPKNRLMQKTWTPSQSAIDALKNLGVPEQFASDQASEFVIYWIDAGKPANSWDSKFIHWVKRLWETERSKPAREIPHLSKRQMDLAESKTPDEQEVTRNHSGATPKRKSRESSSAPAKISFDAWPSEPSSDVWQDYLAVRKHKRAPATQTVINRLAKQLHIAHRHGMSVDDCLATCCERGWLSFRYEWTEQAKVVERSSEPVQTTLPEGFALTRERIALARAATKDLSRDITDVFNAFVTHFRAKGSKCADWDARWSSWVIEEANRERSRYKSKQEQASDKYTRDMSVIAGITGREWAGDNLNTIDESQGFIERVIGYA